MEGNTAQRPNPGEFVIPENTAYAMTHIKAFKVIEFLMTKLEPVHLEDLDPNDRECPICQQQFRVSEDVKLSHPPVKTVCGHIFGKTCIIHWLSPLRFWGLAEGAYPTILNMDPDLLEDTKTSCPTCRAVFFPQAPREPMESLATRLWFWDKAYSLFGIVRSEKEEHSRELLWEFVEYCRSMNEFGLGRDLQLRLFDQAKVSLMDFVDKQLGRQELTEVQLGLMADLYFIGATDMNATIFEVEDGSQVSYGFNPFREVGGEEGDEEHEEDGQPDQQNPEES